MRLLCCCLPAIFPGKIVANPSLVLLLISFYSDSQKSFSSFQQEGEVLRNRKVHILRSCYVTSSFVVSLAAFFLQESGLEFSGWSYRQTFYHFYLSLLLSQLTICLSCLLSNLKMTLSLSCDKKINCFLFLFL